MGDAAGRDPSDVTESTLMALHTAEYQALTTRNTHWQTVQFQLPVFFLVFLGLVAQTWRVASDHTFLVWGCVVVFECVTLAFYESTRLSYVNVRYIETELRALVRDLLPRRDSRFWLYESWLQGGRGGALLWFEYTYVLVAGLAVVGAAILLSARTPVYWCAFR